MYVEYDSERDFFFLVPVAFLGALADFLDGVLACGAGEVSTMGGEGPIGRARIPTTRRRTTRDQVAEAPRRGGAVGPSRARARVGEASTTD